MEKTTLSKKEQLKLIDRAYYLLDCLNNIQHTHYRDELFDMNKNEEKRHDRMRPDGIGRGLTVSESAKMFTVKRIAEYMLDEKRIPAVESYIWTLQSCFYSASIVLKYRKEIERAWKDIDILELARLDYSELVKA